MSIQDFVLRRMLSTQGVQRLFWTQVRWQLVRSLHDPGCTITAHGRSLRLPLSHELPTYLAWFPLYDTLPQRLGAFLHAQYGPIRCLDVGANIGDTIAALYKDELDRFLAVEPDPKFNTYLHENWRVPNVKIMDLVCAAQSGPGVYLIVEKFGTASFYKTDQGREFQAISVDDLIAENAGVGGVHLLKVDTDGGDFEVLTGARRTLRGKPAVLFESDVFDNTHYVEDCLGTLEMFRQSGYQSMLLYEKFGHPLGRHELQDLAHFKELLFHQLTKKYTFFDILLMKEEDLIPFYAQEQAFFLDALPDQRLRATAAKTF